MGWKVVKLTEEGKQLFSWSFDELYNTDDMRGLLNTRTGEITPVIKRSIKDFISMRESGQAKHIEEFCTRLGNWVRYDDGYTLFITRLGDILKD